MGDYGSSVLGSPKASDDLNFTESICHWAAVLMDFRIYQVRQRFTHPSTGHTLECEGVRGGIEDVG